MADKKKRCPRCKAKGTGPYARWVLNGRKQRYEPYLYFAHKTGKKIKWCYLGRPSGKQLSNREPPPRKALFNKEEKGCRRCSHLTSLEGRPSCSRLRGLLMPETFTQPCEGFKKKPSEERG